MTLPRAGRADRRREGLLAPGEDPMVRRPPARPAGPPPGSGRRRTDLDPTAAPGNPPATGERRQGMPPRVPVAPPTSAQPLSARAAATPPIRTPSTSAAPAARPAAAARPAPNPPVGQATAGPMTSAVPVAGARPRPVPGSRRDAPAQGATAAPPVRDALRMDPGQPTTGMPSWSADPGPATPGPYEVTQRVSGGAPAGSVWDAAEPVAFAVEPEAAPAAPPAEPAAQPERSRRSVDVPVGGRAAARLERQAAEAARKKSGRRTDPPSRAEVRAEVPAERGPAPELAPARRAPRRTVQGLVALALVALGVLGFWSFTSPGTQSAATQSPTTTSSAPAPEAAPAPQSLAPSLELTPTPVGPVRVPITVLNSTSITGLAADVGDQFTAGGWQVAEVGKSPVTDVATSTVYFTEGDTQQQQAAAQLVEQFPDVTGPAPRYFDVPGAPGIVVVVTGNWRP